jgi:hypothetical protein
LLKLKFCLVELHQQFADSLAKLIVCNSSSLPTVLKAAKNCPNLQKIILVDGLTNGQRRHENGIEVISFGELLREQPTMTHTNKDVDLRNDIILLPYSRFVRFWSK